MLWTRKAAAPATPSSPIKPATTRVVLVVGMAESRAGPAEAGQASLQGPNGRGQRPDQVSHRPALRLPSDGVLHERVPDEVVGGPRGVGVAVINDRIPCSGEDGPVVVLADHQEVGLTAVDADGGATTTSSRRDVVHLWEIWS